MDQRRRAFVACSSIVLLFLVVQLGALALVEPFKAQGHQFVQDTSDPTTSIVYIGMILVATAFMLAAMKYGIEGLLRLLVVASGAYLTWYVFQVLFPPVDIGALGGPVDVFAYAGALAVFVGLYVHPEWYVIDAAGIIMGIGAAGLFGINFGILPALVLLTVLAVYDAISVYGTEHMLELASGVMDLKVPIVLVIPLSISYSFLDESSDALGDEGERERNDLADGETGGEPTDRDSESTTTAEESSDAGAGPELADREALFIGLGDAVIPSVLVASAGFFLTDAPTFDLLGIGITLPAATAMLGSFVGLSVLLWMVLKGRAHAGLPLLNGGTIVGYLVGALLSGIPLVQALGLSGVL